MTVINPEQFPAEAYRGQLSVTASNQPSCPRMRKFWAEHPEWFDDVESMDLEIYGVMGTAGHEVLQRWYARHAQAFGNWRCPTCKSFFQHTLRPEHKHELNWEEAKYAMVGLERNVKADMVLLEDDNLYHVYEYKFVATMPSTRAKRPHYLQANLTTEAVSQIGLPMGDFRIYYRSFDGKRTQMFEYAFNKPLADLQIALMHPGQDQEIGICKSPDSWYCGFVDTCFKDGYQGKWLANNPQIAAALEALYWPQEAL
jgi:hypothetical protein